MNNYYQYKFKNKAEGQKHLQTLDPSVKRHKYSFFPLDHTIFLCEKHNILTGNVNFQDNLLNELLSMD